MCGRYLLSTPADAVLEVLGAVEGDAFAPRYNISPTQNAPIVRLGEDRRILAMARWGLVPSWAKDSSIGNRMINARSETVAQKSSFRSAFRARRCLVPADGFYEWQGEKGAKQPWRIAMAGGELFAMAGLWEPWEQGESPMESFTILTTEPNATCAAIHDRMPVILPRKTWDAWLDPASDRGALEALLVPFAEAMETLAVSRHVNSPANDDPRCIEPAAPLS